MQRKEKVFPELWEMIGVNNNAELKNLELAHKYLEMKYHCEFKNFR